MDVFTAAERSALMSRIRGKGTRPEILVANALKSARWKFEEHCRDLPGRPDFVLRRWRIAIFVDGDFWHGWHFASWESKLAPFWKEKIAGNIARDRRNHRKLRRLGWKVIRIWEHQIEHNPQACLSKIVATVAIVKASRLK